MKKSIYKITNLINGKSYIGQTNNVKRRFQEHKNPAEAADGTSKLLHRAIQKYGVENFSFEILEEDIENYDERERYWIKHYHSLSDENGYNIAEGGSAPPILRGYDNPNTVHTEEQVQQVIELLLNTTLTSEEIGKRTNYDSSSVLRINKGEIWHRDDLSYPLRKESTKQFAGERALQIIADLQNTDLTQKEIAQKYGVGRSTITAINNGQNNRQEGLSYPIRKNKKRKTILMLDSETEEVLNTFPTLQKAADFVNRSPSSIKAACHGETKTSGGYKWKYKDE